jgi:hypothetical protein
MTTAALSAVGVLALAGTASADVGDIETLSIDDPITGTAETVEVSGSISCTTSIEYGLVVGVAQNTNGAGVSPGANTFKSNDATGAPNLAAEPDAQGVGAFGPNQGNEDNSPCSSSTQDYEVTVQRNRDSETFQSGQIYAYVLAGTSADNGTRGPGPFIGDLMWTDGGRGFNRTDP